MITRILISPQAETTTTKSSISNQWTKLKKVWNGENCKCFGIERVLRVFLAIQAFFFPGLYFRYFLGSSNNICKKIVIETYVVGKFILSFFLLFKSPIFSFNIYIFLAIYFTLETILYVLSVIFLEDVHKQPQSFSRSLILIFINYFEITIWFAILYKNFGLLSAKELASPLKALYFSLATATTVGYGDITPLSTSDSCIIISMLQMIIMLIFVVLFFNKFVGSINSNSTPETNNDTSLSEHIN